MFNLSDNMSNVLMGVAFLLIGQLININYENSLGAVFVIGPVWTVGLFLIVGGIVDGIRNAMKPKRRKRARM
nr:MAG TPA: Phosphoinositide-interacting protein family [Caudoviricetes sp.]